MSGRSSNAAKWFTQLEPARLIECAFRTPDDPRLRDVAEFWSGDLEALRPSRAVLIGFPQDEGVRRNHGRPGAAQAPCEIRRWFYRLTPWDCEMDINLAKTTLLDAGDLRMDGPLEQTQEVLGDIVAEMLSRQVIPIVLGGGHETAYGHYLGYVKAQRPVSIVNIDAHLDLRPYEPGRGHSGSPFRQAMEHRVQPLPGNRYVCLGAQPQSVSREHWMFARDHGCTVRWYGEVSDSLLANFQEECAHLAVSGSPIYVTVDADATRAADVPGVSAPNVCGLRGKDVIQCARLAGALAQVASFDIVEINPLYDRDGQSARWAALLIWNFLAGLAKRR